MTYDEALKEWGYQKLTELHGPKADIDQELVEVSMDFNEGFNCCGGSDPGCYCSYAESPSSNVVIQAGQWRREINADDFNFADVLKQIVEAGGGTITS